MTRAISSIVTIGLIGLVWFSVGAHAAHDLWAASVFFAAMSLLFLVFCTECARQRVTIELPFLWPVLACLGAVLLSGRQAYDHDAFRQESWGWVFVVLAFYIFVNTLRTPEQRLAFFKTSALSIVPLLGYCVWQQATGHPANYGHWTVPGIGHGRWGISYGHWEIPGTLINSIVLAGFALFWPLLCWTQRQSTHWAWPLGLAALATLGLARSWWAFLCLLLGALLFYRVPLMSSLNKRRGLVASLFVVSVLVVGGMIWFKSQQAIEGSSYQAGSRWIYWMTALRVWVHHPWTGVGLGGYPMAFLFFKAGPAQNTLYAHSFPLQWLAETGLLGVGSAVLLMLVVFLQRKAIEKKETPYAVTAITIFCFSLININMEYLLIQFLLVLVFAASLKNEGFRSYRFKPFWFYIAGASVIFLSPFWAANYQASRLAVAGQVLESQGRFPEAITCYRNSLALDGAEADSAFGLSRIFWMAFEHTHDPKAYHESHFYLAWAIRDRKDPRMIQQLTQFKDL